MNKLFDITLYFGPTLLGSLFTGIIWMAKALFRARRDIDIAFYKIREIERQLKVQGEKKCQES